VFLRYNYYKQQQRFFFKHVIDFNLL
jgi:hypothetical protein